jgi:hypothetical protein
MDFSGVEAAESSKYLLPGRYLLRLAGEAKFEQPEGNNTAGQPKSALINVKFTGKAGQITEKFYVSPKEGVIKRLQYLHVALTGKECTKAFKSIAECGKYYETLLNDSRLTSKDLHMTIGATEAQNGKFYSNLPYTDFILDADIAKKYGWEEEVFEEGSKMWESVVRLAKKNASHATDDVMITSTPQVPDTDSDLPF